MKILFICSSNVCRSAFCDFVFKKMTKDDIELEKKIKRIDSAAVFNRSKKIFHKTKNYLLSIGYEEEDLDAFKPRYYKDHLDIFEEADIIIGMTKSHYRMLPKQYRNKFTTLSEAVGDEYKAIPDPWLRLTQNRFNKDMHVIEAYLERYKEKIKKG